MSVAGLPHIDDISVEVAAPPEVTWEALCRVVPRTFDGRSTEAFAAIVGCEDRQNGGGPLAAGTTLVGFHVAGFDPPVKLALEGRHRFARYGLTFRVDEHVPGTSRLIATTHAAFPGFRGRIYRALVIGSRIHVLVSKRLLNAVKRRAERGLRGAAPPQR